ncbi:MAG: DUF937 domain-containing protein [Oscillochloridaceae bacterium umkhey_bin13]
MSAPSVLATITSLITPGTIEKLSKQFGLSDELTRQGLALASALIIGGLARATSTPEGAERVAVLVDKQGDPAILANLASVLDMTVAGKSPANTTAQEMFGGNYDLVINGLKRASGIDVAPFLGLVAPVVLGVTKNIASQQSLDAAGLGKMLQGDLRSLARRDAATSKVLKEVFKPLDAQDKLRATFSDDEWASLQKGPIYAAALIILADPSGSGGRRQEVEAMQLAIEAAVAEGGPVDLIDLLFHEGVTEDEVEELFKAYKKADEAAVRDNMISPIVAAVKLVGAKAPAGDAAAYKGLIVNVAQQVAGATKEGGFLGMGGTAVSAEEKAAIDALVAALNAG